MPNWCNSELTIEGTEEAISRFKVKAPGCSPTYNSIDDMNQDDWGPFESIRIKAIYSVPPEQEKVNEALSFHALFPVPEHVRCLPYHSVGAKSVCDLLGIAYETCGYSWELDNWGTKWGGVDVWLDEDSPKLLRYNFNTPWSPPMPWLNKVAADWPELTFDLEYTEPGMGFRGSVRYEDGKLVFENEVDYSIPFDEDE